MPILLSDEEIVNACKLSWDEEKFGMPFPESSLYDNALAAPLLKAQLKNVVEWGDKQCLHAGAPFTTKQRECEQCWQSLKKEAGLT